MDYDNPKRHHQNGNYPGASLSDRGLALTPPKRRHKPTDLAGTTSVSDEIKQAVEDAALRILEPLAQVLLEAGVGVGEFHAIAKLAYLRAAIAEGRAAGHMRPNVSRIAAATGLTRVDIAAHLAHPLGKHPPARRGRSRAESVLAGWHEDAAFRDPKTHAPALLKRKGTRRSFAALARRYSGDSNSAAILQELIRAGAARVLDDGRIEALSRTCANVSWDPEGLAALGEAIAEHLQALVHNLQHPEAPYYARRIECLALDAQAARVLIPEIREHAELFLESTEIALRHPKHLATSERARKQALKFAVAVHFFQAPAHRGGSSPLPRSGTPRSPTMKAVAPRRRPPKNGAGAD